MQIHNIETLNRDFAFSNDGNNLSFSLAQGNMPVVNISNTLASACISLQGAHLLSWIPTGEEDVIWISEAAVFAAGKAVRGGIPICWPWFGAHTGHSDYPAHGFVRTALWQVKSTESVSEGITQIVMQFDTSNADSVIQKLWPWPTMLEYCITVSKTLTLEVKTTNHSDQSISIGQALHSYFSIGDISNTCVYGLEDREYQDKTDNFQSKKQIGSIHVDGEIDRVYLQTDDDIIIDNTKRKIIIKKQGSLSTIVWNPWQDVAAKMADLNDDAYQKMICVESANAADDTVSIPAGESHMLSVEYEVG